MQMFQDGVEVQILPENAHCKLDENAEYILDLEECPQGCDTCNGDCFFYIED